MIKWIGVTGHGTQIAATNRRSLDRFDFDSVLLPYNFITNTYWADQFGAQTAWELDIWGKLRRAIESADGGFLAFVANYDDVLVTLVGDVATAYVQIRTT